MEYCQAIVESHGNSESHHIDTDQPIEFKVKSDPLPFYGAENSREEIKSNMLHNGLGTLAEDGDKESQNNFPVEDNEAKNGLVLSDQKIIPHCLFVNPVTDFAIADKYFFTFKEIIEIFMALQDHRFNNILLGVVSFSKMGDSG